jgi:hypothetical protein
LDWARAGKAAVTSANPSAIARTPAWDFLAVTIIFFLPPGRVKTGKVPT